MFKKLRNPFLEKYLPQPQDMPLLQDEEAKDAMSHSEIEEAKEIG